MLACTDHAQGMLFSLSVGTRNTLALIVAGIAFLSFLAIVASNGNRRIERAGYLILVVVLLIGGGTLAQGEMKPLSDLL